LLLMLINCNSLRCNLFIGEVIQATIVFRDKKGEICAK